MAAVRIFSHGRRWWRWRAGRSRCASRVTSATRSAWPGRRVASRRRNWRDANAYDRFYLNRLEAGRSTVYITRLLRTLKSLGITLSVTFDDGRPGDGKGGPDD